MLQALNDAAGDFRHRKYKQFTPVLTWNVVCGQKYQDARNVTVLIERVIAGKVRQGPLYDEMKYQGKSLVM